MKNTLTIALLVMATLGGSGLSRTPVERQITTVKHAEIVQTEIPHTETKTDLIPDVKLTKIPPKPKTVVVSEDYGQCKELGATYWKNYLTNLPGVTETERAWLLRVANCESHFHNCSKNKNSSASGLFQYLRSTFRNATKHLGSASIWDGHLQTKLALNAYRGGQQSAWVCK